MSCPQRGKKKKLRNHTDLFLTDEVMMALHLLAIGFLTFEEIVTLGDASVTLMLFRAVPQGPEGYSKDFSL